ncbi:MAG: hypothetical protein EPO07_02005 [Verrucomicrobia bacterium]|nr:MAG: hypothetical protein EPO07_02005 [Verrucomicrobiota bacterium]
MITERRSAFRRQFAALTCFALCLFSSLTATAVTTNRWTNSISALWRTTTNWSSAALPSTSFDLILITNTGTKTVTLDAVTAAANRAVRGFQVFAPVGFTNTLLVSDISGTAFSASRASLVGNGGFLVLSNSTMTMGSSLDFTGGLLVVTNSTLTTGNTLDFSGGSLNLDSGTIDTTSGFVDVRIGRLNGAIARVTQSGGNLNCYGLRVGDGSGSQGYFTQNGGVMNSLGVVTIGELLNCTGAVFIASGQFIATNDITKVGNLSQGTLIQTGGTSSFAFLSIADNLGGTMNFSGGQLFVNPRTTNDWFRIGNMDTGNFNMSGGLAVVHSEFHVGDSPGVTGNANLTGGQFFATNDLCAIGRYGSGFMTVSDATAVLTNTSVGRHTGADGTLNLQSNATVVCLDTLSIARFAGSSGQVLVNGGLLSLTNDDIWVGREGTGQLGISAGNVRARGLLVGVSEDGIAAPDGSVNIFGGLTLLSSNCVVGTAGVSTGHVFVVAGNLILTNAAHSALLRLDAGDFTMFQGNLTLDNFISTNPNTPITFTRGTISAGSMTISNGAPFVIGDGVNPATLQLQGGMYSFADGLVISSGATVTGCGTIIGGIVNNGTLSTNCGVPAVAITQLTKSGSTATISFTTLNSSNHVLEFKNALADPAWLEILPGVVGNGSVTNQQDTTATNGTRFYRIHVQ